MRVCKSGCAGAVKNQYMFRTSLAVQWLRLQDFAAEGTSLIPGQGPKIPHAIRHGERKKIRKRIKTGLDAKCSLSQMTAEPLSLVYEEHGENILVPAHTQSPLAESQSHPARA